MTVYLALKKYPTGRFFDRLAAWLIKARLVSAYYHGGILIGDALYHATSADGFHGQRFFDPDDWELYPTQLQEDVVEKRMLARLGAKYDWFSLLAFVGLKARDSKRVYCFEACFEAMTGEIADKRITAETLLALVAKGFYASR
jgi:hypothetical protein